MQRPTVNDIAKEAGVSLATVDRVLNARPGVRARTVMRVNEAIERLGWVRDVAAANLARRRSYRVAFVLPDSRTSFMRALRGAIESAAGLAAFDRTAARIVTAAAFDPTATVRALAGLDGVDGVALMAPETPQVRDAIGRLALAGTPVVALVSDQPNSARNRFVGINNLAAGRTAAQLVGRFARRPDPTVLVVAGSMMARDQMERRLGFDETMLRCFPGATVLPSIEGRDDSDVVAPRLAEALAAHPEVDALYALGAGHRGLVHALGSLGLAGRITVVAHELTPATRAALEDGTIDAVITQDVGHIARSTLRVLRAAIDGTPLDPGQEQIRIEILLRENLPPAG
ncbi:LacI family DNA-binding transcriptional regulator [Salinarimonas chemoclinalis]|uniref:LacI family DNA-binding transcriptional regulator n=1 Tax=Salinarimonas chemoclinalis TaxID=3241599 RepID=UPI0035564191